MRKCVIKKCGVYKIQSKSNPCLFYIGASSDIDLRWYQHTLTMRNNNHSNKGIQDHYNKYGPEDLDFSIIMYCNKEDLHFFEQWFFNWMKPTFNVLLITSKNYATKEMYIEHMTRMNARLYRPRKMKVASTIDKYQ